MYGQKIRMVRELRGLKQEHVASRLGIAQNTYSQYENNQIKITVETLQRIAEILEVNPMDLMSHQPAIIKLQSNMGTQLAYVENFISYQKEMYEEMIASKNVEIERLQSIIDNLLKKD